MAGRALHGRLGAAWSAAEGPLLWSAATSAGWLPWPAVLHTPSPLFVRRPALPLRACAGLGQAGTLLFGKAIAHNFDVSSRAWYLLASAKLNLAMGWVRGGGRVLGAC